MNANITINRSLDWVAAHLAEIFMAGLFLLVLMVSVSAGGASYATYPCENQTICPQADLHKSNGNPYASVILNNQVENFGTTLRLKDCDLFDCRVLLQITPAVKININNDNKIEGWFTYNHDVVEYKGAVIWDGSSWQPLDLSGTKNLEAGTTYFFGLDYHKSKPSDAVDLIPAIFGVNIDRWAWWNDTFRYKIGYNLSNAGSNLTNYELLFPLDLNESITNGSNLRATWVNGSTEQAIDFWRSDGNYNGDTVWVAATAAGSVWAKVPLIPNGTNTSTVYFYYSDFNGLPDLSNASNTFMAYSDCNSTTGWTVADGTIVSTSGWCTLGGFNGTSPSAHANLTGFTLPNTSIVEWRSSYVASNESDIQAFVANGNANVFKQNYNGYVVQNLDAAGSTSGLYSYTGPSGSAIKTTTARSAWSLYTLTTNATNMTLVINGSTIGITGDATYAHGGNVGIAGWQQTTFTNNSFRFDDIRIRTQADVAPTISGGVVEDSGNYTVFASSTACGSYTQIANFTVLDETTSAIAIANATFNITSLTAGITNSTFSGISPFYLCKANNSPAFNITVAIQYWNTTAGVRNYYMTADNTTNTTITLFLAPSSLTSAIQFTTSNQYGVVLTNRVQHYLRYFPANNSYQLVAMGTTDANGQYVANIFTNGTTFYQIISFKENSTDVEKLFTQEPIYCIAGQSCTHALTINSNGEDIAPYDYWQSFYGDVQSNCSFTNLTRTIACTYADVSGQSHTFDLNASRMSYGNPVSVCNATSTGASGTLLCTISDTNLTGNVYSWIFIRKSNITIIQQGMIDYREVIFATLGLGIAFILIITIAMIGMFNPMVGVVLAAFGLIAAAAIGLIDLPIAAVAGILLVGFLLAWRFSRH
jgi:hypothetical protein